jgi:hypothetical protein
LKNVLSRLLLGAAAARPTALRPAAYLGNVADYVEDLLMRLPFGALHAVSRKRKAAGLEILL